MCDQCGVLIEKMRLGSRGVQAVLGKSGRADVRSLVDAGLCFSGTAGTERWSAQVAPVSVWHRRPKTTSDFTGLVTPKDLAKVQAQLDALAPAIRTASQTWAAGNSVYFCN